MNKSFFKSPVIKSSCTQKRGAIRVRPGTILWHQHVSIPTIRVKTTSTKKETPSSVKASTSQIKIIRESKHAAKRRELLTHDLTNTLDRA
jgi:hypothetical protein